MRSLPAQSGFLIFCSNLYQSQILPWQFLVEIPHEVQFLVALRSPIIAHFPMALRSLIIYSLNGNSVSLLAGVILHPFVFSEGMCMPVTCAFPVT